MPRKMDKVIITCAVTGGIHTPTMSDALPVTPDAIAEQAEHVAHAKVHLVMRCEADIDLAPCSGRQSFSAAQLVVKLGVV